MKDKIENKIDELEKKIDDMEQSIERLEKLERKWSRRIRNLE